MAILIIFQLLFFSVNQNINCMPICTFFNADDGYCVTSESTLFRIINIIYHLLLVLFKFQRRVR